MLDSFQLLGVVVTGLMVIACLVGCYIVGVLRVTTRAKIQKVNNKLKDSALIMTIEMSKARAAFNES